MSDKNCTNCHHEHRGVDHPDCLSCNHGKALNSNWQPKFSDMVKALVKPGNAIIASLTEERADLLHMVVGVSGEAGELLDAVKKHVIYDKPLNLENVIEELGDIEFYMERIRQRLCITRDQTIQATINKLSKRYGDKYSDSAAQARADKS